MVANSRSRRGWAAFVVALILAAVAVRLGLWQLGRADEKQALMDLRASRTSAVVLGAPNTEFAWRADLNASALDQSPVILRGQWRIPASIALDNRAWEGRAGAHVLTPFQLTDGSVVWVNRGWMPKPPGVQVVDIPAAPPATEITGVALASVMRRLELSGDTNTLRQGNVWQNFDWVAAAQRLPANTWPVIVWQTSENPDGLLRKLPDVSSDVPKHLGYAAQWFCLAALALFFGWRLRPTST